MHWFFFSNENLPCQLFLIATGFHPITGRYFDPCQYKDTTLRENCLHSEFFWSAFSRIWTEYGEIRSISPYSVRMRENADQKNSECEHFSCSANDTKNSNFYSSWGTNSIDSSRWILVDLWKLIKFASEFFQFTFGFFTKSFFD